MAGILLAGAGYLYFQSRKKRRKAQPTKVELLHIL
ncbi:hypothetical protein [Siphonobacter sp. BAB-5405]